MNISNGLNRQIIISPQNQQQPPPATLLPQQLSSPQKQQTQQKNWIVPKKRKFETPQVDEQQEPIDLSKTLPISTTTTNTSTYNNTLSPLVTTDTEEIIGSHTSSLSNGAVKKQATTTSASPQETSTSSTSVSRPPPQPRVIASTNDQPSVSGLNKSHRFKNKPIETRDTTSTTSPITTTTTYNNTSPSLVTTVTEEIIRSHTSSSSNGAVKKQATTTSPSTLEISTSSTPVPRPPEQPRVIAPTNEQPSVSGLNESNPRKSADKQKYFISDLDNSNNEQCNVKKRCSCKCTCGVGDDEKFEVIYIPRSTSYFFDRKNSLLAFFETNTQLHQKTLYNNPVARIKDSKKFKSTTTSTDLKERNSDELDNTVFENCKNCKKFFKSVPLNNNIVPNCIYKRNQTDTKFCMTQIIAPALECLPNNINDSEFYEMFTIRRNSNEKILYKKVPKRKGKNLVFKYKPKIKNNESKFFAIYSQTNHLHFCNFQKLTILRKSELHRNISSIKLLPSTKYLRVNKVQILIALFSFENDLYIEFPKDGFFGNEMYKNYILRLKKSTKKTFNFILSTRDTLKDALIYGTYETEQTFIGRPTKDDELEIDRLIHPMGHAVLHSMITPKYQKISSYSAMQYACRKFALDKPKILTRRKRDDTDQEKKGDENDDENDDETDDET